MPAPVRTLREIRSSLASGSTSVVQLTEQSLAAAQEHSPLNAFLETFNESALADAARVDATLKARNPGPLAGLTIAEYFRDVEQQDVSPSRPRTISATRAIASAHRARSSKAL